jgi:hypothetical protein
MVCAKATNYSKRACLKRVSAKRLRYFRQLLRLNPVCLANFGRVIPCAAASTTRARIAIRCSVVPAKANLLKVLAAFSVKTALLLAAPISLIRQ